MAEVLGLASGIAGLLSLTIEVYSTTSKYISAVKNASSTIQSILRELKSLKTVLTELDKVTEQADFQDVFRDRESSFLSIEDSEEYREILERLKTKLLKQASQSGFSGKLKTLVWPFTEERTMRMVEILRRHVNLFGQALSIDTFFTTTEILKEVRTLGKDREDKEHNKILDWLSTINMGIKQQDIYSQRHPDTGTWLLEEKSFLKWQYDEHGSLLWCPGEPGVGKTVLSSVIIDHLQSYIVGKSIGIAFFYCDYQDQSQQTALNIVSSLVRQLAQESSTKFTPLQDLYEGLTEKGNMKPTLKDIETLLISICDTFDKVYIVIDALDECNLAQRKLLLPLFSILQKASVNIIATSRPHSQDLERALGGQIKLEIRAAESDIQRYVSVQVEEDEDLMDLLTDELRQKIVSTLVSKSNGMFLFAILQIKRICDQMTVREVKRALETMPNDLSQLYQETLQRIKKQSPKRSELGMSVLGWISYAKRPILVDELRHALSLGYLEDEKRQTTMDMDNLVRPQMLVDCCGGLITVEAESQVIRLVHYTAQEYFQSHAESLFPDTQMTIAGACLTYLLFDDFISGPCLDEKILNERTQQFKFLEYASSYWGDHTRGLLEAKFSTEILELVKDDKRICAAAEVWSTRELEFFRWCNKFGEIPRNFQSLAVAASQGLDTIMRMLLKDKAEIEKSDGTFKTPAHWAAWRGHESSLALLLDEGVDIHIQSADGFTLLDAACDQGHENVVKLLLKRGFDLETLGFGGATALQTAAGMGRESIVQLLVDSGAKVDQRDEYGETPLLRAALKGNERIVRAFLGRNVDLNCSNECGNTALHCASFYGKTDIVQILLDAGANISLTSTNGATALHFAAYNGHVSIVNLLVANGIEIEAKTKDEFPDFSNLIEKTGRCIPEPVRLNVCVEGSTALHEASLHGRADAVEALINAGADINTRAYDGSTPLISALLSAKHTNKGYLKIPWEEAKAISKEISQRLLRNGANLQLKSQNSLSALGVAISIGDLEIFRSLLDSGGDVHERNESGWTLFHSAMRHGSVEIGRYLIEIGADIFAKAGKGIIPLHLACQSGSLEVLNLLFDADKIDIEVKDELGRTPLMWSIFSNNQDTVQFLLSRGADIESGLSTGQTPLFFAVWIKDRSPLVSTLIQAGAKLDAVDSEGLQPIHRAAQKGSVEAVRMLLDAGVPPDQKDINEKLPLSYATDGSHVDIIELLLHRIAGEDWPPLFAAVYFRHASAAEILLKNGADVNSTVKDNGWTVLHYAVKSMSAEFVELLLKYNVQINALTTSGLHALHIAAHQRERPGVMRVLLDSGVDPDPICHLNKWTPLQYAASFGYSELVEMLLYTGKVNVNRQTGESGTTPLFLAVKSGSEETVRVLLSDKSTDPNLKTSWGRPPSHCAAQNGYAGILRQLLDAGAEPNAADPRMCTVLMWGCQFGNPDVVNMLLNTGKVGINDIAVDGDTALHCTVLSGKIENAKVLLALGPEKINAGIKNSEGLTPRDLAKNDQVFIELLDEFTKSLSTFTVADRSI